ncbi:MAG: peptidase S9, partial [Rhodothermales bacterium]|nr:peptidase S9 [Rhodothermales bacterium]
MMYSVFGDGKYTVYGRAQDELAGTPYTAPDRVAPSIAAILPPSRSVDDGLVGNYLGDPLGGLPPDRAYEDSDYNARLKLDYVAPPSVGVTAGGPFGSGVYGGIAFYFSDMLGNQNLTVVAQAQGTFKDIGGQVAYLNRENRLNWGGMAGHIPVLYSSSFIGTGRDPDTGQPVDIIEQLRQRIYIDQVRGVAAYPFSTTRRLELTGGFTRYGFDYEVDTYYFTPLGVRRERTDLSQDEPDAVYFGTTGLALVTDYSFFGFTSPIRGGRSRIEVSPYIGSEQFIRLQADYRKYFFLEPFTVAFRGLHVGNYGAKTGENQLFTREYLGLANSLGFVRGYSLTSFDDLGECTNDGQGRCAEYQRLLGTRIGVASLEFRVPLLGTDSFGLLNFPYLPTELTFFADGGVAWTAEEAPELKFVTERTGERVPVFSTGVSTRFNMFGYLVLEIFYAHPFQRPGKGSHFGFQLIPGW